MSQPPGATRDSHPRLRVTLVRPHTVAAPFRSAWDVTVDFECTADVADDAFEVKVTYLGSNDASGDQVLDWVSLSPVQVGRSTAELCLPPPETSHLTSDDLLDVSAIVFDFLFRGRVFQRASFFVRLDYPASCVQLAACRAAHIDRVEQMQRASEGKAGYRSLTPLWGSGDCD